jgi:hypothetical protein
MKNRRGGLRKIYPGQEIRAKKAEKDTVRPKYYSCVATGPSGRRFAERGAWHPAAGLPPSANFHRTDALANGPVYGFQRPA